MSLYESWSAGKVRRKHAMDVHRNETVAEHTWGALHCLFLMWPNAPTLLIKAVMYHDFGERWVGDVPATTKWASSQVGEILSDLELEAAKKNLPEALHDCLRLDETYSDLIELCDRVEFCLSMEREYKMGNSYALVPYQRSLEKFQQAYQRLSEADFEIPQSMDEFVIEFGERSMRLFMKGGFQR